MFVCSLPFPCKVRHFVDWLNFQSQQQSVADSILARAAARTLDYVLLYRILYSNDINVRFDSCTSSFSMPSAQRELVGQPNTRVFDIALCCALNWHLTDRAISETGNSCDQSLPLLPLPIGSESAFNYSGYAA